MSSSERRVVVTGIGVIGPLGNTKEELWAGLQARQSGVRAHEQLCEGNFPLPFAAAATGFDGKIDAFGPLEKDTKKAIRKALKVMCRESQMGVAASQRALADAGLVPGSFDPERVGITYGSDYMLTVPEEFNDGVRQCLDDEGRFEFSRWATHGMPQMAPLWLLKYLPNMPASHLAIFNDLRGPNNSLTLREAASLAAVGEAFQTIRRGSADAMLVGATGTRLHPMKAVHSLQQEEIALGNGDPARVSRPFDLRRTGMVLGEGAGAVILEERAHAEARGATVYAEVVGAATSSAADRRRVARRDRALANAMRAAMELGGLQPAEVGHVHAHGLSTRSADVDEARAIAEVFGERAATVPVTAAKSYFGNLGAGGGMVELACSLLALWQGRLFATLNYETPDPECPLSVVSGDGASPGASFVTVNVTPQGQAAAVAARA
jgi:3-oxoacyl-[acyl-carrier-protein] synthase II